MIAQLAKDSCQLYFDCSIGLHFNLTEGRPLNPAFKGCNLVENGHFRGKAVFYN